MSLRAVEGLETLCVVTATQALEPDTAKHCQIVLHSRKACNRATAPAPTQSREISQLVQSGLHVGLVGNSTGLMIRGSSVGRFHGALALRFATHDVTNAWKIDLKKHNQKACLGGCDVVNKLRTLRQCFADQDPDPRGTQAVHPSYSIYNPGTPRHFNDAFNE